MEAFTPVLLLLPRVLEVLVGIVVCIQSDAGSQGSVPWLGAAWLSGSLIG